MSLGGILNKDITADRASETDSAVGVAIYPGSTGRSLAQRIMSTPLEKVCDVGYLLLQTGPSSFSKVTGGLHFFKVVAKIPDSSPRLSVSLRIMSSMKMGPYLSAYCLYSGRIDESKRSKEANSFSLKKF